MFCNIKPAFPHTLDNALKDLSDFCVYSFAFSHQLPAKIAKRQWLNSPGPTHCLSVSHFFKHFKKKRIQGHKNPLLQQYLARELASSQPFIKISLQSVTLDAGLLENKEKLLIQLER